MTTANPASFVSQDFLAEQIASPGLHPLEVARFHANVWTATADSWLPVGAWQTCAGKVDIEAGEPVWVGADVGGERSASAVAWATDDLRVGAEIYHGDAAVRDCLATVRELAGTYTVREIAFDPWRFQQAAIELEREGLPVIAFPQSNVRMVPASEGLYAAVIEGRISHPDNPTSTGIWPPWSRARPNADPGSTRPSPATRSRRRHARNGHRPGAGPQARTRPAPGMAMKTWCLGCGVIIGHGSYCNACQPPNARKGSTRQWRELRQRILERDAYTCRNCGAPATHVDHLVPVVKGGRDHEANLGGGLPKLQPRKRRRLSRLGPNRLAPHDRPVSLDQDPLIAWRERLELSGAYIEQLRARHLQLVRAVLADLLEAGSSIVTLENGRTPEADRVRLVRVDVVHDQDHVDGHGHQKAAAGLERPSFPNRP